MQPLVIALGAAAVLAGGVLFFRSRRADDGLTNPTTLVVALSLLLLGYHLLAWNLPEHWMPLRMPSSLWPLLVGGVGIAIAGALLADSLEGRREGGLPAGSEPPADEAGDER